MLQAPVQAATIVPSPPQLSAKAWLMIDADSSKVLAEHNADMLLPPASLTKMMTSYLLAQELKDGRLQESDKVTISDNAWSQNPVFAGSSLMWIEPGMEVSVGDLQRGVIISSGNDSTVAVAEHIAGSEAVFAEMMNTTAKKLGMVDTHYSNSHGLDDEGQVTTARDLAVLAQAMIRDHPEQYAIYKEQEFTFNNIKQYNRNTLLNEDPTVDGLKTGYTKAAGYCLVASAKRDGMRLITVVMGTSSPRMRKNETRSLLNYGFRFFETSTVHAAMTELENPRIWQGQADTVPVGIADAVLLTLPRGKAKSLVTEIALERPLLAPVAVGDKVGTFTITLDGETVFDGPLAALAAVEQGGFFARLWDTVLMWFASLFDV